MLKNSPFRFTFLFLLFSFLFFNLSAQDIACYAGNSGEENFFDVIQLSDGTMLIAGTADDLDWLSSDINRIEIDPGEISNNQGNNKISFLLHTDEDLTTIHNVIHLPGGGAEDFRFIKTTNEPRKATGDIFLSGNTEDSEEGGYFIGKLNNNFVDGLPTAFDWTYNVKCTAGDYPKLNHPWDVDAEGRAYFVRGDSHDWNWSSLHRLDQQGQLSVVENWRTHWVIGGGEFRGTPASQAPDGIASIEFSGLVFKRDGRCNLRSWTTADYDLILPDGNGGTKKGKWPLDALFAGPCDPAGDTPTDGPGYTGYRPGDGATYGPSSVCVDRRNNEVYIGLNAKSILPDGNPDFEPAVLKMNSSGELIWWSRLYHEKRPDGSIHNSSPDQYIDGLAIDYSRSLPASTLVVNARCHGNNTENLWEGNTIFEDANRSSFQNQFTGNSGNIHISWLGKLNTSNGDLQHSTYVAELGQNTTGIGAPHPDPLLNGWPDPNTGWPNLNTTRLVKNTVKVTADGSVLILGYGRRPMTTSNAFQQMPNPYFDGRSAWSYFVRQYEADFSIPVYSSIVRGVWDTLTTEPPLNVELNNAFKTREGIVVVGKHLGTEGEVPVSNIPDWGKSSFSNESAFIAYLKAPELFNDEDAPITNTVAVDEPPQLAERPVVFPNPVDEVLYITSQKPIRTVTVYNLYGQVLRKVGTHQVDCSNLDNGTYFIRIEEDQNTVFHYKIIKQ